MSALRTSSRVLALPAALGLGVLMASPASAHVTIAPGEGAAGAYTVATVSVPHGCEEESTVKVTIQIPEQILSVTPTRNAFWDVEKVMEKLDEPVEGAHGNEITERVSQIVYTTDEPLPTDIRDSFELSFQVPDAEGETLLFPTVQDCDKGGEAAWIEDPAGGEDVESPAPSLVVTAAEGDGHSHGSDEESEGDENTESADQIELSSNTTDEGTPALTWVALGVGALGLAVGVAGFARGRKA